MRSLEVSAPNSAATSDGLSTSGRAMKSQRLCSRWSFDGRRFVALQRHTAAVSSDLVAMALVPFREAILDLGPWIGGWRCGCPCRSRQSSPEVRPTKHDCHQGTAPACRAGVAGVPKSWDLAAPWILVLSGWPSARDRPWQRRTPLGTGRGGTPLAAFTLPPSAKPRCRGSRVTQCPAPEPQRRCPPRRSGPPRLGTARSGMWRCWRWQQRDQHGSSAMYPGWSSLGMTSEQTAREH